MLPVVLDPNKAGTDSFFSRIFHVKFVSVFWDPKTQALQVVLVGHPCDV